MKATTLILALLTSTGFANPVEIGRRQETQTYQQLVQSQQQGVRVLPRINAVPLKDGEKKTVMPYGPYKVSKANMMTTFVLASAPCSNCLVTAMEATIRYPDGREANVNTGGWLHHIAMFGMGAGQMTLWAAGNERPTLRLNNGDSKYGLEMPSRFMLMIDLMVDTPESQNLKLEITYHHVPKNNPGYKPAVMYWLTIGEPAAKDGVYHFNTFTSYSGYNGKLLYSIGHLHDGGTDMRLFVNKQLVCKSIAHYNVRPEYTPPAGSMAGMDGHSHGSGKFHISDPGACVNFGRVKMGDSMYAEAWYDTNKYPLMVHNGKREGLMGNMRVYIGPD